MALLTRSGRSIRFALFTIYASRKINNNWSFWFQVDFEKHYSSAEEEAKRKAIFGKTLEQVKEHNKRYDAGEVTYSMGLNAFSDLNPDEVPTGLLLSKGD